MILLSKVSGYIVCYIREGMLQKGTGNELLRVERTSIVNEAGNIIGVSRHIEK